MNARRQTLRVLALAPLVLHSGISLCASQIPPVAELKAGYRKRLTQMLGKNALPYIDIESSCNPGQLDINGLASALDLGGDRMHRIAEWDQNLRTFLKHLPRDTQHHVAYRSAWKLLFGEEFA